MSENVLVVRPAWRREWRGFLLLGLLLFAFLNAELVAAYAQKPLYQVELLLKRRITIGPFIRLGSILLFTITIIRIVFRHYRHKYQFSQEGVAHIIGILGREERPLSYRSITLATKRQGVFEYLFGVGTIFLHSSGTDTADVVLRGVPSPKRLLDRVQNGMRSAESSA